MKPYGIPRMLELESPDLGDIRDLALKSCTGRLPPKHKDQPHRSRQRSGYKRAMRRVYKGRARCAAKAEINATLSEPPEGPTSPRESLYWEDEFPYA